MKIIPSAIWSRIYGSMPPTPLQRWWIQRWLELTDTETDDLRGLPMVNSGLIIAELVAWKEYEKRTPQGRTLYFLLAELQQELSLDLALQQVVDRQSWFDLRDRIDQLVARLRNSYSETGSLRGNYSDVKQAITLFRESGYLSSISI